MSQHSLGTFAGRRVVSGRLPACIWIVDDNPETREQLSGRLRARVQDRYQIVELDMATATRKAVDFQVAGKSDPVALVAVHLAFQPKEDAEQSAEEFNKLRFELPSGTPVFVYHAETETHPTDCQSVVAGLRLVGWKDLGAVVIQELLRRELGDLAHNVPIAADVLDAIDVGISVQSPEMEVLWANRKTIDELNVPDIVGNTCWKGYHSFLNREWRCAGCTAHRVLDGARQSGPDRLTGYHLLPIRVRDEESPDAFKFRIAQVEVNAASCYCGSSGELLAVVETTRFSTTDEWERKPAHQRIREVLDTAREMGEHRPGSRPLSSVAVYYRSGDNDNLFLFDASIADDTASLPKVLRVEQLPDDYRQVLTTKGNRFVLARDSVDGRRHFLEFQGEDARHAPVLIDAAYKDEKPDGLLTHDLAPYWQYVQEHFLQGIDDREKEFRRNAEAARQGFLAATASGIHDEAHLDRVFQSTVECVQVALRPLSMYIRVYNRETNCLEKRKEGLGKYFELAPASQPLGSGAIGSARAASQRREVWEPDADLDKVLQCLDSEPSEEDRIALARIVSYVTVPIMYDECVLGTLNVQFDDDSLLSDAKKSFLKSLTDSLATAMIGMEWLHERRVQIELSQRLDEAMFRKSKRPLEDQENQVLGEIIPLVFHLTRAEQVLYYRLDRSTARLRLVPHVSKGAVPGGAKPPAEIPAHVGIVGIAVANGKPQFAPDYSASAWKPQRDALVQEFTHGAERAFCERIGCAIAVPVLVAGKVHGVFLALSTIPRWMTEHDAEVVNEFAFKTGLAFEARHLTRQLNWENAVKERINDVRRAMAWSASNEELHRLFLLTVTAGECLGFSRAILFLRAKGDSNVLSATVAVGSTNRKSAEEAWATAGRLALDEKIAACAGPAPHPAAGELRSAVRGLVLDLGRNPACAEKLHQGKVLQRRRGQPHFVQDPRLLQIVTPRDDPDVEYVLAPLKAEGEIIGAVLADRAFLLEHLEDGAVNMLGLLTGEFGLLVAAAAKRRREEEASITDDLAWGVGYSLRTQASVLENRLENLAADFGDAHSEALAGLRASVEFFMRAGTLAGKSLRVERAGIGRLDQFDLVTVVAGVVSSLGDPRISATYDVPRAIVRGSEQYLADAVLEVLVNSQAFVDKVRGRIAVHVAVEARVARLDVEDNGPGIHPGIHGKLFQKFTPYPASRMGLGLAYAHSIVAAHRGSIEEIGKRSHGAHFVVRIPLI